MVEEGSAPGVDSICPYLGLKEDRATHSFVVDADHFCYRSSNPHPIDKVHQRDFCLRPEHSQCRRFLRETAKTPERRPMWQSVFAGAMIAVLVVGIALFALISVVDRSADASTGQLAAQVAALVTPSSAAVATPKSAATTISTPTAKTSAAAPSPTASMKVHVVAAGETLSEISKKYDVKISAILKANNLENESMIQAGQKLLIPGD